MEKVILPKEVAEAIEEVWSEIPGKLGPEDSNKITWLTNWRTLDEEFPEYEPTLIDYYIENPVDYVSALAYGYDVEETPHEKLRAHYEASSDNEFDQGYDAGVRFTLNTLGIEIEGIND
ncbi:hypothetical protein [Oceanobacillus sojae]|uniref:hypothetical protein n=1 Tax=Oceanobacillus sojae TaxID=582851 RepID=UPI0009888B9D|nr:hypothetical protein [Oceanobacillus sojae]